MARSAVVLLFLALACTASASHDKVRYCGDLTRDGKKDCLDGVDKDTPCAWCEGDDLEACLSPEAAYGISSETARCKGALPPRDAICSDLRSRSDCVDSGRNGGKAPDCAWCEGDNMASCVDAEAAYSIPLTTAVCHGVKVPRKAECGDLKKKSDCLDAGKSNGGACAWCKGDKVAMCLDSTIANFIPAAFAKCKGTSLPDEDCKDLKTKETCLKGTLKSICAWCEGDYLPKQCLSETGAKFLPSFVADCRFGKDPAEGDDDDDADDKATTPQ